MPLRWKNVVLAALIQLTVGCNAGHPQQTQTRLTIPLETITPPESVTTVKLADYAAASPFANVVHIVRLPDGQFLALSAKDPNGGCTVPWNEQAHAFWNPCHGATYNIRGEVLAGPAIRGLDRFPVRASVQDRKLYVDVANPPARGADVDYHRVPLVTAQGSVLSLPGALAGTMPSGTALVGADLLLDGTDRETAIISFVNCGTGVPAAGCIGNHRATRALPDSTVAGLKASRFEAVYQPPSAANDNREWLELHTVIPYQSEQHLDIVGRVLAGSDHEQQLRAVYDRLIGSIQKR